MMLRLATAARLLPGFIVRGWTRQYEDARIILEQNGDLHYLNISAKMQRILVRGGILATGVMLISIFVLLITSVNLMISRTKLERSHEEVYRALLSSASDSENAEQLTMNDEQMVALAQTIRDRDMSIRRFVDTSMVAVSQENVTMKSQLESSGLTEKIVKIIQQNAANGGFNLEDDLKSNPLLRGKVADELSTNRGLREVLYALPSVMPVPNYSVTSDFGVRRHPLTGQTHFHTGLDLLSQTGDEKVHPVKPGVVVLAQFHTQYGNTVVVRHTNGVESLYAHMANIEVKLGDKVTHESVLGNIGSTGSSSTGKHLHLEILIGGYPVNPQKVIRTAQYVQQIQNQQR
ncbi:M23 family metallopeptidase [Limnohabitans sp.]|uniref:M23 family metallopeptidase n=1 Tax=Limnohabitans sp. TaxID=1907725 RepID=UPI0033407AAC